MMLNKQGSGDNRHVSIIPAQRSYKEFGATCTSREATCYLEEDQETVSLRTIQDSFFYSEHISPSQIDALTPHQAIQNVDEDQEEEEEEEEEDDDDEDEDDEEEDEDDESDGQEEEEDGEEK